MNTNYALFIIAVIILLEVSANEPQCACSKFHYEEQLLEKMVRMEFAMENMKKEMNEAKISSELQDTISPAFTARLSTHRTKLGYNQVIIFDDIITNIGQAYSGATGVFTVPKDGIYYFIATTMSYSGERVQTEIVRNGESMMKQFSSDRSHEQGTSAVVLHMNASDGVWVRHLKTVGENVYGHNWSTFSGFKI